MKLSAEEKIKEEERKKLEEFQKEIQRVCDKYGYNIIPRLLLVKTPKKNDIA